MITLSQKTEMGSSNRSTVQPVDHAGMLPPGPKRKRILPFHPLLFALFPLLALYTKNSGEVPLQQLGRPLGLALVGTLTVWALFFLFTRNLRKAALTSSAVVLVFFSYGHLLNTLPTSLRGWVAPACVVGVVAIVAAILRSRQPLFDVTKVLNVASVILVAPSAFTVGVTLYTASVANAASETFDPGTSRPGHSISYVPDRHRHVAAVKNKDLPDVYYIILDAYGGTDSLKTFYGYDNTPFIKELEKRGFYLPKQSRANYDQTPLCLASSLNMTYLDDLVKRLGAYSNNTEAARQMLDDNEVAAYLAKLGYHYVNIWSGAGQTEVKTADLVLNGETRMSNFEGYALSLTALDAAPETEHRRYNEHRDKILGAFRSLDSVGKLPYHKFVFAHVLAPHPPFVFGANGEAIDPKGPLNFADASWLLQNISRDEYKRRYIAQMQYVNQRVLQSVDAILRQSRRPPIIILQGDHGSRMNLDWSSQERTDAREVYSILNAYYLPKQVRKSLHDGITPVNSFRVVLNRVFGAKYEMLPDRSYYSTADQPYAFSDVTRLVKGSHIWEDSRKVAANDTAAR